MPRKAANLSLSDDATSLWVTRIKASEKRVKEMRDDTRVYRDAFHGSFPMPFPDEEESEQVYVNRVQRVVLQWTGAMYAQNPTIRLKPPWRYGDVTRQILTQQEAVSNAELDRVRLEESLRRALQSSFLDGWAWVKSGFSLEWEDVPSDLEERPTNAEEENAGFELMDPSFFPREVYLTENHEEHQSTHAILKRKLETDFGMMQSQYQALRQQGTQPSQQIENELIKMQTTLQAMKRHEAAHIKQAAERDRKGRNETNYRVLSESCWVDTVHNSNVIWDLHCTGPHDWRWVGERYIRPTEEMKRRFKNQEIVSNYSGSIPGSAGDFDDDAAGGGVNSEFLEKTTSGDGKGDDLSYLWKIWDAQHRRVIWFHEDKPVKVEPWPHRFLRRPPLRMLYYKLRADEFWPISPIKDIWPQQLELNRYRTKASIIMRRYSRQALADPRIPDDLISDIIAGRDGAVQKLKAMGVPIDKAFAVIDWGGVPGDVYNLAGVAQADIEMDTGLGEQGLSGQVKAKTATAAKVGASAVGVTLDDKLVEISKLVRDIATDQRGLMRQYYTADRYTKYMWEKTEEIFKWTGEALKDFEVQVELGSSRKQDRELLRMQLSQAIELGSNIPGVDFPKLYRLLLSTFDEIRDPTEFMLDEASQGQPQPQQGVGPGQGQGQQENPGREAGPQAAQGAQPSMDMTK